MSNEPVEHSPLERVSLLSFLTVSWTTPVLDTAVERQLKLDDLPPLPEEEEPTVCLAKFDAAWKDECASGRRSLPWALLRAFRKRFVYAGVFITLYGCFSVVQPFAIREILQYVRGEESDTLAAALWAGALAVANFSSQVCLSQMWFNARRLGIQVLVAVLQAIYRHSLSLTTSARLKCTIGNINNLMAVDAERLLWAALFVHFMWLTPIMVLTVLSLLVVQIGPAAVAGIGLMALVWPLQIAITRMVAYARRKMMINTDARVKFLTEVIRAIRAVKLYAWEKPVGQRIASIRDQEAKWMGLSLRLKGVVRELMFLIGPLITFTILMVIVYGEDKADEIDVVSLITMLAFINILRFPAMLLTQALSTRSDGMVAARRVEDFLLLETFADEMQRTPGDGGVVVSDAVFHYKNDEGTGFSLGPLNLSIAPGEHVAVVGKVGSGKSTLISALLGELPPAQGTVTLAGRVAYMGSPWIQNMSLRNNILFSYPFDADRYRKAVHGAALIPDLAVLQSGDQTEIGERGINLSGGQKARVCIARCLYAARDVDVVILDDPLSAVDAGTGDHIYWNGLRKLEKTVVVCLNSHLHLLRRFDKVVVLDQGKVVACGPPDNVRESHPWLFPADHDSEGGETPAPPVPECTTVAEKLIKDEKREAGQVKASVYWRYFSTMWSEGAGSCVGIMVFILIVFLFAIGQAVRTLSDLWMARWADSETKKGTDTAYIYFSLVGVATISLFARVVVFTGMAARGARNLHNQVFQSVMSASIPFFFDITTTGEILNKFSKDTETVDYQLPEFVFLLLQNGLHILTIIALCIAAIPYFSVAVVFILFVFHRVSRKFSFASRDLKRLEATNRTPMFAAFSETLSGLETIRAFGASQRFAAMHSERVRRLIRCTLGFWMSQLWMMLRTEMLSVVIISTMGALGVALRDSVSAVLLGLALSYALQLSSLTSRTIDLSIQTETFLTAAERLFSFLKCPKEDSGSGPCPPEWPRQGEVVFDRVALRYRSGPLVLKNVSFTLRPGERVGVCGRTGAGKSSLLAALFRVVPLEEGCITIDGLDIATVPLDRLRSSVAIIPQDPVILSGDVRGNLDPFAEYGDQAIWEVLDKVGMRSQVEAVGGLDSPVSENGENLSTGQRQLLCIARALLRKTRVLVLDEATASIDLATDTLIQRALRTNITDCTVLTIAHRLETIADYDRVLVLGNGELLESGPPSVLLRDPSGAYASMLSSTPS
eukprot:Sspe_Gene.58292::Locus_31969_Transcript_1_1_Confidence_1.000_Length_4390::g.58292::m.58292/K05673/ABCC4; ATP-binding cassette, subfamily C (CFTR/MRP), member 4